MLSGVLSETPYTYPWTPSPSSDRGVSSEGVVIQAYGSQSHYARHITPILAALPAGLRGSFASTAAEVPPGPVIVAGWADAHRMAARDLIYVEHGCGMTYTGLDPEDASHYAGGRSVVFDSVRLFVCPSERVARVWRGSYPDTPAVVVGCPALDPYLPDPQAPHDRTLAISFHYDAHRVCPETRSAFPHYRAGLPAAIERLRADGWRIMGHGHPRAIELKPYWASLGVQWGEVDDVLRYATVLAIDNSSLLYEMAALGRPTIAMNAPWYRRDVNHGLRFWSHIPDMMIDSIDELRLDDQTLRVMNDRSDHRRSVVEHVYGHLDGRSAERTATAIVETLA